MKRLMLALLVLPSVFATTSMESVEFAPLQDRAQGRSLAGSSVLNDSLYKNPAASVFTQVYSIDATYLPSRSLAVSILDTKTSVIGGALGYFRRPISGREGQLEGVKAALSSKVADWAGVGVGIKNLWGPAEGGAIARFTDLDLGMLARFSWLTAGVTLRNLLGGERQFNQRPEWALGVRAGWEETLFFSTSANIRSTELNPYQVGFGAEYVSPYYFSLKGGYFMNRQGNEVWKGSWSAGASFLSPRLSLHYAVEIPVNGDELEHAFGATLLM